MGSGILGGGCGCFVVVSLVLDGCDELVGEGFTILSRARSEERLGCPCCGFCEVGVEVRESVHVGLCR